MLIDTFDKNWIEDLCAREEEVRPLHRLYLLIDGAFVPKLNRLLRKYAKVLLFESLPGCTVETQDVSPFLTQFSSTEKTITSLLRQCNRWPMVSVIETPESLKELSDRLAAWCVVEADGQRFNFRFPDTRRLPAIFNTLTQAQRAQLAGPAVRWTYVSRDGHWRELPVDGLGAAHARDPELDQRQFARLVDDSRADELLALLRNRGNDPYRHPSRSHALLTAALRAAAAGKLDENDTVDWCEWFWRNDQLNDDSNTVSAPASWGNIAI